MERSQNNSGLVIKLARIQQGIHLYQLAKQAGITPARLSQFEGGHRQMPPHLEQKLLNLLGLQRQHGAGEEE